MLLLVGAAPATFWAVVAILGLVVFVPGAVSTFFQADYIRFGKSLLFIAQSVLGLLGAYGLWVGAIRAHPITNATAIMLVAGVMAMSPLIVMPLLRGNWEGSLDNYLHSLITLGPVGAACWLLGLRFRRSGPASEQSSTE